MFKLSTTLLSCLYLSLNLWAQEGLQTENSLGVEELVKNVFIKGNCKNVSNITALGSETLSIGQFENGENNININDGIILSTGDIGLAQGPNIHIDASYSFDIESADPDLSQIATTTLFDVTGIEFDFVPLDNNVKFRYVFASEEYCEFVGTAFNDVFGFFVSGPGINGPFDNNAINVATVTDLNGIDIPVSINNINHLSNETFYVSNITTTDAQNCSIAYSPQFQTQIEYDAFTIALTASFQVIPCETYHIRLVIGDVGDPNLDSAVFLESNSFDLGEEVIIRAEVPNSNEPVAYESCIDGQFVFTRGSSININQDFTINYTISSDSEAINGVDFEEIPLSVTIPAGETSFVLPITTIEDNMMEGPENLKLELFYDCDCIDPTLSELIINDFPNTLSVDFEEIVVCAGQAFSIEPIISGGVPPFEFLWDTGAETESLEATITEATQYSVSITDFCGNSSMGLVDIGIQNRPSALIMGTYDLCETLETGIPLELAGNPPWGIRYSIDGVEQAPVYNVLSNPFFLSTPKEGTYELIAFNDAQCEGDVMGSAVVEYSNFDIATDIVPPSCFNRSDGSINITQLEAVSPFSIEWNTETDDDFFLDNLIAGTYTLSIVDGDGCLYEERFELQAVSDDLNDCAPILIPNCFSPNNDGINDVFSIFFDEFSGITNILSLQIYNRWGTLIFEQNNFIPNNGATNWRGNYKGKPLNMGVFVYQVMLAFEDGRTQLVSGEVTLLR